MPKERQPRCPCGSGRPRAACCGLYLDGLAEPPTAEALMRARYTANVEGRAEFLAETFAPETGVPFDADEIRRFSKQARWTGLKILETTEGGPDDQTGTVTFEARFRVGGRDKGFRERSRFRRVDERWRYIDGDLSELEAPKVGRNAPCPCGSGKKYKRCCGR